MSLAVADDALNSTRYPAEAAVGEVEAAGLGEAEPPFEAEGEPQAVSRLSPTSAAKRRKRNETMVFRLGRL